MGRRLPRRRLVLLGRRALLRRRLLDGALLAGLGAHGFPCWLPLARPRVLRERVRRVAARNRCSEGRGFWLPRGRVRCSASGRGVLACFSAVLGDVSQLASVLGVRTRLSCGQNRRGEAGKELLFCEGTRSVCATRQASCGSTDSVVGQRVHNRSASARRRAAAEQRLSQSGRAPIDISARRAPRPRRQGPALCESDSEPFPRRRRARCWISAPSTGRRRRSIE